MYIHVLIYILYHRFINVEVRDINDILLNEISTVYIGSIYRGQLT